MSKLLKKIVVLGPESTGKSTLCAMLAQHYETLWCPEFAREYLLTNGKKYSFEDLEIIAKGQLALEDEMTRQFMKEWTKIDHQTFINTHINKTIYHPPPIFIDTDMHVMKVWCEYVFGKCHQFILDEIVAREYDLFLLCNIDLPWVKDELREYPDEQPRKELFHIYQDLLINQSTPWKIIEGTEEQRFLSAVKVVDEMLLQ